SDLSNVWRALNPPNATGFIASAEAWGGLTYVPGSTPGDGRLIAGGWYFSATGANAFISVYEDLNASNPTRPYSEIINTQGIRADWVFDNTVDSRGNIYVAGFTTGNIDSAPLGEGDAFVIKYSPQLTNPIYQQFGTDKADLIRKMMIQNDTLYTVGYTYGNYLSNNADPNLLSGDVFVQKLDTNLNLLNGIQFGTPHEDRAYGYIKGNNLWIGGMTEGYMTGENLGSFDGFLTAVKTTDLTFIKPLVVSVNSKISDSEIKLYPNPTSDMLRIDFGKNYTKLKRIEVFNAMGQSVKVITTIDDEIDVSSLSSGLYFVRLELENGIQIKRLVKQ
ncbi:MAG: T9SS type A sorting domain-containing protein, partial [Bacteroidota bacterium]